MLNKAIVIWLTGMSGVGKSTLSNLPVDRIKKKGLSTLILDGDYVRKHFHSHLSFTQEDILENNRLVAELCVKNLSNYDLRVYKIENEQGLLLTSVVFSITLSLLIYLLVNLILNLRYKK